MHKIQSSNYLTLHREVDEEPPDGPGGDVAAVGAGVALGHGAEGQHEAALVLGVARREARVRREGLGAHGQDVHVAVTDPRDLVALKK